MPIEIDFSRKFAAPADQTILTLDGYVVRTFRATDAPAVKKHLGDPVVWNSYVPADYSFDADRFDATDYLIWQHRPHNWSYAVATTDTDEVVGCVHATHGEGAQLKTAELGAWLAHSLWGSGLSRTVGKVFVDWLFKEHGVLRVYAVTYHPNRAAFGALLGAGFELEAVLRCAGVKDGQTMDHVVYSRLNPLCDTLPRASSRPTRRERRPK
jgi:RimJ/RimL family protein N-acetyltransferase